MRYLLGIDNGGTKTKCALFNLQGDEIAVSSCPVPLILPQPGMTERDPELVWQTTVDLIRDVIHKSGADPREIIGIGLTGYGNGMCLVDANGNATWNCIVSTDTRGAAYAEKFAASGIEREAFQYSHQCFWAAQPAVLLPWFKDNAPEVLERSAWVLGIKDFIRLRLTGTAACEFTEASSWGLMNIHTLAFEPRLFELLGLEDCSCLMPPCLSPVAVSGTVSARAAAQTGLAEGTPVAGGCFDVDAGAIASGVLDGETLCLIAGTWSINEYLAPELCRGYRETTNSVSQSFLPGQFLVEESTPTSASNFEWFVENFLAAQVSGKTRQQLYAECDQCVEILKPEDSCAVFVPYLFDSATVAGGKGAFFNLSSFDKREHLIRAVYEGVVFSTVFHVHRLVKDGHAFSKARLSGGVTNSRVWSQMMCDALGLPVEIPEGNEPGAKGAAICAGIACGVFANYQEAIQKMVKMRERLTPRKEQAEIYAEKFQVYEKALAALECFHGSA